ncbi:MAG: cytochrome c-type biogenesis protein [Pseudomonadota bacterium]
MKRLLVLLCVIAMPLFAVEPDEVLDDPVLEERARAISAEVRCVVCQNEPIDSSDAGVARDLRMIIRERLVAGDTDQQVFDYLVLRYGDFVLFNPPWKPSTYALWLGPFVILVLGFLAVVITLYRKRDAVVPVLDAEEQAKIDALLKDKS